jgi:hypothetical protein
LLSSEAFFDDGTSSDLRLPVLLDRLKSLVQVVRSVSLRGYRFVVVFVAVFRGKNLYLTGRL